MKHCACTSQQHCWTGVVWHKVDALSINNASTFPRENNGLA